MGRYRIRRYAREDSNEILNYVAADNLNAALAFNDRLTELFELLSEDQKIGRERPEIKEDLRSFPEGNYVIFYRLWAGELAIVRILHSARDIGEVFDW